MPTLTDPSAPITTESLLRLAMADPNTSAGAATLRWAIMARSTPAHVRELALRRRDTGTEPRPLPVPYTGSLTPSPAEVEPARSRDLTAGEVAWLAALPTAPAEVDPADGRRLAALAVTVRTPAERAVVRRALEPITAHHEARQAVSTAERALALMPTFDPRRPNVLGNFTDPEWPAWRDLLAEQIEADTPALTRSEATDRACGLVAEEAARRQATAATARAALGSIVAATGVASTAYPEAIRWAP